MAMNIQQGLDVLASSLSTFREKVIDQKLPDIVFPEFVAVNSEGGTGLMSKLTTHMEGVGSLDDGLIGVKTTSVDTVDFEFQTVETPIVAWAKSTSYTLREIEIAQRAGINVDLNRLMKLRQNADQTLQKVAFIGHATDARITGLLNNPNIKTVQQSKTATKSFEQLTGDELSAVFVEMFKRGLESTNLIEAPNFIIVPALDYVELATKNRGAGTDTTVLNYVLEALQGAAGKPVTIKPCPLKYADTAGAKGKKRMMCYINDPEHVEFDIPVAPEVLDPQPKSLNSIEVGMRMDFGSVVFHEPNSAIYIDYPTV